MYRKLLFFFTFIHLADGFIQSHKQAFEHFYGPIVEIKGSSLDMLTDGACCHTV